MQLDFATRPKKQPSIGRGHPVVPNVTEGCTVIGVYYPLSRCWHSSVSHRVPTHPLGVTSFRRPLPHRESNIDSMSSLGYYARETGNRQPFSRGFFHDGTTALDNLLEPNIDEFQPIEARIGWRIGYKSGWMKGKKIRDTVTVTNANVTKLRKLERAKIHILVSTILELRIKNIILIINLKFILL